ncbi:MAG: hypothetical protein JJE04_06735 [Acidobacteriia bacterium]|nr:hypothetical protein [Terriglobia bacterium]
MDIEGTEANALKGGSLTL